jgi:arylsulfatase A-like enzyme
MMSTDSGTVDMNRPNIVFILADDLGWNDLGAQGSTFYESPNLDRLAAMGMRFTHGYAACQVCSPSRASIMTGKVTPRHGITDYLGAKTGVDWRKHGRHDKLLPASYADGLRKDEITFAEALRRAGYRTFYAGKWHLGEEGQWPEDFGFEINKGGHRAGQPDSYFSPWQNPRLPSGPDGESLPLRLGRETAYFIEANKNESFLAFLSFYSVHSPLQTTRERWAKYRQKAVDQGVPDKRFVMDRTLPVRQVQDCPVYGGMIEAMDDAVGIVLAALESQGLLEIRSFVSLPIMAGCHQATRFRRRCCRFAAVKGVNGKVGFASRSILPGRARSRLVRPVMCRSVALTSIQHFLNWLVCPYPPNN